MTASYAELHLKRSYSFGMGASHAPEMLVSAREHGYGALALTDTDLCSTLEFARLVGSLDIQPITGRKLTPAGQVPQGLRQPVPVIHAGRLRG